VGSKPGDGQLTKNFYLVLWPYQGKIGTLEIGLGHPLSIGGGYLAHLFLKITIEGES
jgi:hypothetical protein